MTTNWPLIGGTALASALIGGIVGVRLFTKLDHVTLASGLCSSSSTMVAAKGPWTNNVLFFPDFSKGEPTTRELLSNFEAAKSRIQLCLFRFSYRPLGALILKKFEEGLLIEVIVDADVYKDFASGNNLLRTMVEAGIPVKLKRAGEHMHHKFSIIDETAVMTGSLNWTEQGITKNDEDVLISIDQIHVARYMSRFTELWKQSKEA